MFDEHSRFSIWNPVQHPYRHAASDLPYTNPATGQLVSNLEQAIDWLFAVAYPKTQASVATTAALPLLGNAIGDMRFVEDDGDGKGASYRWLLYEGEASPSWKKWADIDFGAGSIIEAYRERTLPDFVHRRGWDDLDDAGVPVVGFYAGQVIYGGASANTNLTLRANAGDGVGPNTGFVQFDDNSRPAQDSVFDLGTITYKWNKVWTDDLAVGSLLLSGNQITEAGGLIDFDDENLQTLGTIQAGTLFLAAGSITDTSGQIDFDDEDLVTTGDIDCASVGALGAPSVFASGTTIGDLTLADGSITSTGAAIDFGSEALSTTGTLDAGAITGTSLTIDGNLELDGSLIRILTLNTDLELEANGTGVIAFNSMAELLSTTVTGDLDVMTGAVTVTGLGALLDVDNIRLDGNTISTLDVNGNLILDPNGTGQIIAGQAFSPDTDNVYNLGQNAFRWARLYLVDGIHDGTDIVSVATLLSLRNINAGAAAGMTLFYDGSQWLPSLPDSEVDHGTITGLLDDDHTQYALLAGRALGQQLIGGTGASENLTLDSTAHATKGFIVFGSSLKASADNARDLGEAAVSFKDLYLKGQAYGLRVENAPTISFPAASGLTVGRLAYDTTLQDLFIDRGGTWKKISVEKYVYQDAVGWDGIATSVVYDVSAEVSDAREGVWVLKSNADSFRQMAVEISMSQTHVTVTVGVPLPAGTYTLVGVS